MTQLMQTTGAAAPFSELSLDDALTAPSTLTNGPQAKEVPPPPKPATPQAGEPAANGFLSFGLAAELVQAVQSLGFVTPTAVQRKTIPLALPTAHHADLQFVDLMVSSQTGSGKTAAFLLPVLHTLLAQQAQQRSQPASDAAPTKRAKRNHPAHARRPATPGALVVCPTRELAQQVAHDAIDLVRHCRGLRIANVVGGMPYSLQIAKLQNANLVVATPGRLLDLQRAMQIKLDQVQFLVVDEADRMLDLGFADDLAEINQLTIERKQTMMFSATFAPRIEQLAARVMRKPQRIQMASPTEKHLNIKQLLFWADNPQHKRQLLDHWLRDAAIKQAIVFASTQIECDGLAHDLQQSGFSAVALHGALNQGLRNRRLLALRQGQVQILVATDVAARGLDVPALSHVFNFGLPMKVEDYTHRIGRTGRAGRDGLAITFAEFRDRRKIADIESYSQQKFQTDTVPGLEPQQRFAATRPGAKAKFGARGSREGERGWGREGNREGGRGWGSGFSKNHGSAGLARARGPATNRAGFVYSSPPPQPHEARGQRSNQRNDFAAHPPTAAGKPASARPSPSAKVFVPRDFKKRASRKT